MQKVQNTGHDLYLKMSLILKIPLQRAYPIRGASDLCYENMSTLTS